MRGRKSDWEMTVEDLDFDDSLSGRIIECFIRVHNELGSGLYESIYKKSLLVDFEAVGIAYECEKYIDVFYRGVNVGVQRLDLLVEQQIIVELKVVEQLSKAHYAQLRSYLR